MVNSTSRAGHRQQGGGAGRGPTAAALWTRESLLLAPDLTADLARQIGYHDARDAVLDPRGRTVRCTPWRRTVAHRLPDGAWLFQKHRGRRPAEAADEWDRLIELRELGYRVPAPAFLARLGRRTVVGMFAVPGRPIDAMLGESAGSRAIDANAWHYLIDEVAPLVRRLHDAGLFYRDLYWNHLFAERLDPRGGPPALIDVERVFRPSGRRRRWLVKDLAGLCSSWPTAVNAPATKALRFLRAYQGPLGADWKRLARAVLRKAARIRAHAPRYG